jgi:molybdopterin/thiamine biosynthesis adenylyltransferase
MIELVLAHGDVVSLKADLIGETTEKCAVLFATQTSRTDGTVRLLTREVLFPAAVDYTRKGPLEAELTAEFVAKVTKHARRNYALVFVHSHPGDSLPTFSRIDDDGEKHLAAFLAHRHPGFVHCALVISAGGMSARRLGTHDPIRVVSVGVNRDLLCGPEAPLLPIAETFERQIRAFGKAGQQAIQQLRIGIVGLGGTGSIVAQQLAHLGVRDFILVDPDTLERTNLNRVANATPEDVERPKVDIASRSIRSVAPGAKVDSIKGDIIQTKIARELLNADIIFGCTDSHGSRAVLQQVSYQYLIPCIDMGVTIAVLDGQVSHIFGRVQLLAPGLACFTCDGLLNAEQVRLDMMTEFERQADPYVQGAHEPAPAVMSLNSTVASLGVTMLLSMVAGVPAKARHILYNAMTSTLRHVRAKPQENCYICSVSGSYARGDAWPLFTRET